MNFLLCHRIRTHWRQNRLHFVADTGDFVAVDRIEVDFIASVYAALKIPDGRC